MPPHHPAELAPAIKAVVHFRVPESLLSAELLLEFQGIGLLPERILVPGTEPHQEKEGIHENNRIIPDSFLKTDSKLPKTQKETSPVPWKHTLSRSPVTPDSTGPSNVQALHRHHTRQGTEMTWDVQKRLWHLQIGRHGQG